MDSWAHLIYKTSSFILVLLMMIVTSAAAASANSDDVQSLLAFKRSITQDPFNRLSNWNSGSPDPCNWTGIICSSGNEGGRVVEIQLGESNLHGSISEHIGNLSHLQILNLTRNPLSGAIPASLGRLSSLQYLRLSGSLLQGSIPPALGNCSNLSYLNLGGSSLQGTIPFPLLNCRALEYLNLQDNQISGTIPGGFLLPKLQVLNLRQNSLAGSIPDSVCNATSLTNLLLSQNQLTGAVPLCLVRLPGLEILGLGNNQLESGINSPEEAIPILQIISKNASTLKELALHGNNLSGILPSEWGKLHSNLKRLTLFGNSISGSIPESLGNLSSLTELDLSVNLLTGMIPAALAAMDSIRILKLTTNRLQGQIPDFSSRNLQYLHLCYNQLSGQIPASSFGKLIDLYDINLSNNLLTGTVPLELGNSSSLAEIDFSYNRLSGYITPQFMPPTLKFLSLSYNNFSGVLPRFINTSSIETVNLRSNNLTGSVPGWVYAIPHVDLSDNDLEGSIACSFDRNVFLGNLKIQYNCSEKPVPPSMHFIMLACIVGSLSMITVTYVAVIIFFLKKSKNQNLEMGRKQQQQDSSFIVIGERELIRATNNLDASNFLGRGRYGDVYKGKLSSGITVAIKLFSAADDDEETKARECFERECRTLGQIRHRNLVKIITVCCNHNFNALILEFMPNGNLDDLLHCPRSNDDGRLMPLSLRSRIRLLKEVAGALSYLHHDCNPPIIHRDLKPQNILFDEDMCAHISDFDLACILNRSDMIESLCLHGSIGYIAPEYGTEAEVRMSGDVYSFGVLILEVMTRIRPTDAIIVETDFTLPKWIAMVMEKGRAHCKEVIMKNRAGQEELESLADEEFLIFEEMVKLGLWCSLQYPDKRPTMREVENMITSLSGCVCDENSAIVSTRIANEC